MSQRCGLGVLFLALGFLAGCAPATYRLHPSFQERSGAIKTVALLPPDVKVYQLSAGGVRQLMDEWSETARKTLAAAIAKQVVTSGSFVLKEFDPVQVPDAQEEFRDIQPLFEAVASSALVHTYRPETTFQTKKERFEYSVGPIQRLTEAAEADALLFAYAVDHVSTGGRVALNVLLALVAAAAGVVVIPAGGPTVLVTALVDSRTGDILWFNARGSGGAHDLRDPASVDGLVADTFTELRKTTPVRTAPAVKRE